MKKLFLFLIFIFLFISNSYSKNINYSFNDNIRSLSLYSSQQNNYDSTDDKKYYPGIIVKNSFYIIGSIFPITNILGYPYFLLFSYIRSMNEVFMIFIMTPLEVCGFLSTIASAITLGAGGYQFFIDQSIIINKNLFISSIVCIGISYLFNLIIMFITLPTLLYQAVKKDYYITNRVG